MCMVHQNVQCFQIYGKQKRNWDSFLGAPNAIDHSVTKREKKEGGKNCKSLKLVIFHDEEKINDKEKNK